MERWKGRVALVTGASVGIGAAIAEHLVKKGMVVVGCARNVQAVQNIADSLQDQPGKLHAIKCDVTKESEILAMFDQIKQNHGGIDVCINNAGLAYDQMLLSGSTQEWRTMLDVNVLAVCICTREAYKSMEERGIDDGQIIQINSITGKRVGSAGASKSGNFYSATKFAVTALTEGVRNELRDKGSHIRINQICPGLVESDFHNRKFGQEAAKKIYDAFECLKPKDIAEAVEYVLSAPPHVQIHEIICLPTESPL